MVLPFVPSSMISEMEAEAANVDGLLPIHAEGSGLVNLQASGMPSDLKRELAKRSDASPLNCLRGDCAQLPH
jgi:hypothetical protein